MNDFGKEVRKAMIDSGVTVTDLAERMGVCRSYVSNAISGRRKVPPSFCRYLIAQGLATVPVQIEYAIDRRAVDATGLSREQIAELVKMADGMRKAKK